MFISWIKSDQDTFICPICGFSFEEKRINNPSQCPKCLSTRKMTFEEENKINNRFRKDYISAEDLLKISSKRGNKTGYDLGYEKNNISPVKKVH